VITKE
jgi:NAD(P)H-flavin reductase